jgi:hypothetical protein
MKSETPKKYRVYVDDNFNYMDEDKRYQSGEFDTEEEAVAACKRIVDEYLRSAYKPGMTADVLYDRYRSTNKRYQGVTISQQ